MRFDRLSFGARLVLLGAVVSAKCLTLAGVQTSVTHSLFALAGAATLVWVLVDAVSQVTGQRSAPVETSAATPRPADPRWAPIVPICDDRADLPVPTAAPDATGAVPSITVPGAVVRFAAAARPGRPPQAGRPASLPPIVPLAA